MYLYVWGGTYLEMNTSSSNLLNPFPWIYFFNTTYTWAELKDEEREKVKPIRLNVKNKHVKRWNEFNTWNYLCFSLFMLQIVNKCCMEWIKLSVAVIFLIQCRVTLSSLTKCIHHNEFSSVDIYSNRHTIQQFYSQV